MRHDINLNIHYSTPQELWDKIGEVYSGMPYWAGNDSGPCWKGPDISLWASVEPGGLQIAGEMPGEIWDEWFAELKEKLASVMGYEIGEPEDGFEFRVYD